MLLRYFLYIDRPQVRSLLAQVEGGEIDAITERSTAGGTGGMSAKVGYGPVGVGAEKSKTHSHETELTARQVPENEFQRLYSVLDEDGLVSLDACDNVEMLAEIRRGQALEVSAELAYAGVQQFKDMVAALDEVLPAIQAAAGEGEIDPEAAKMLEVFKALSGGPGKVPVIATVPGGANLQIGLELDPDGVRVDDLAGDATVVLKVTRILREGESKTIGDIGGLLQRLPSGLVGDFAEAMNSEMLDFGMSANEVTYPALLGSALAIFR